MKINQLKKLLYDFSENLYFEYDLKKKNWFNIGGKSKVFFKADYLNELMTLLKILDNRERIFILGAGSNILITDDLFDGVESDLKQEVKIKTEKELLVYSYRVAGTVGLMMAKILGVKKKESLQRAIDLGIAMQLKKISQEMLWKMKIKIEFT